MARAAITRPSPLARSSRPAPATRSRPRSWSSCAAAATRSAPASSRAARPASWSRRSVPGESRPSSRSRGGWPRTAMGRTYALANQKGGVGKTTTAINLGSYLGLLGKRVLLVDMDPQANATSSLGYDKREGGPSVYDALTGSRPVAEVISTTEHPGVDLL